MKLGRIFYVMKTGERGISLVELICSLGIIMIISGTFLNIFVATAQIEERAKELEEAQNFIERNYAEFSRNGTVPQENGKHYTKYWIEESNPLLAYYKVDYSIGNGGSVNKPSSYQPGSVSYTMNNNITQITVSKSNDGSTINVKQDGANLKSRPATDEIFIIVTIADTLILHPKIEIDIDNKSEKKITLMLDGVTSNLEMAFTDRGPGVTVVEQMTKVEQNIEVNFGINVSRKLKDGTWDLFYTTSNKRYGD